MIGTRAEVEAWIREHVLGVTDPALAGWCAELADLARIRDAYLEPWT